MLLNINKKTSHKDPSWNIKNQGKNMPSTGNANLTCLSTRRKSLQLACAEYEGKMRDEKYLFRKQNHFKIRLACQTVLAYSDSENISMS